MSKNHHKQAFDEGTLTKLDIFQAYAEAWLGILSVTTRLAVTDLWIWDFFAGPGLSVTGQPGSPLRILKVIEGHAVRIMQNQIKIHVRFNDKYKCKYEALKRNVNSYIETSSELSKLKAKDLLEVKCYNSDFGPLFKKIIPALGSAPALMFLDQNGVKYIGDEYLLPLLRSKLTDFLFFVSTSYFARFSSRPEFIKNVPFKWNPEKPYNFIHREVINYVRSKIPYRSTMRVYPFSIRKGSNIYGLIFGASHILAAEKFLTIAWDRNTLNGEANFDIDDDEIKCLPCLFDDFNNLTKIEKFQEDVEASVRVGTIKNNREAYFYAINHGFLPKQISTILKDLKRRNVIDYDGKSPLVSYENAYKQTTSKGLHLYKLK